MSLICCIFSKKCSPISVHILVLANILLCPQTTDFHHKYRIVLYIGLCFLALITHWWTKSIDFEVLTLTLLSDMKWKKARKITHTCQNLPLCETVNTNLWNIFHKQVPVTKIQKVELKYLSISFNNNYQIGAVGNGMVIVVQTG